MKRKYQPPQNLAGRPTCYSCFRPLTHCFCKEVASFAAHFKILILQHPNERHKFYSTSKLVVNTLTNARLLRGIEFTPEKILQLTSPQKTYLLYPSRDAIDCETVSLGADSTVIVIDGTWMEAKKVMRLNPILKEFPHLTFKRDFRSNYLIRKQPAKHCLSTLESIGHLLKLNAEGAGHLEKLATYNNLFHVFNKMVERQASYFPRNKLGDSLPLS